MTPSLRQLETTDPSFFRRSEPLKIGDIIARKDMPQLLCQIVGENEEWDMWVVRSLMDGLVKRRLLRRRGMIAKDDDRWYVVREGNSTEKKPT